MTCASPAPSLDICPTTEQIIPQLLALLPRGRAWSRHAGGPFPGERLYQFWTAVASVFQFANQRMCDLRREFFCATQSETTDMWMADYGLPDGCDPYPNLCAKVAAQAGTNCAFYQSVAAAAGWDIECRIFGGQCGSMTGPLCGTAKAGTAKTGRRQFAEITIVVKSATSPSFGQTTQVPFTAGLAKAGRPLACAPSINGLVCLIERIVHAELLITYEVV